MFYDPLQRTRLTIILAVFGCLSISSFAPAGLIGPSSLSGIVYVDDDFDGECDTTIEWVLPNIEIWLMQNGESSPVASTVTDERGRYEFSGLDAGTYAIMQIAIPVGYANVLPCVGELLDIESGEPASTSPGEAVLYDQQNGIMPQIAQIELPEFSTRGINFNFGQVWLGKAWYLTGGPDPGDPPGANPPVPEPSAAMLVLAIGLCFAAKRRFAPIGH